MDRFEPDGDGLADAEELSEKLSLSAQITMLFKTIEILGQILKDQYARIQRPRKVELLKELFNGPMRALADFVEFIGKNPAALVLAVDAELTRKSAVVDEQRRKEIARKAVASITQLVTWSFVMRTAETVSSESLLEDIESAVKKEKTLAFRLIELAVVLDSPKSLPRKILRDIYRDAQQQFVAERILYLTVLHRLYMFKTSENDMQWLSAEMNINLEEQHKITYQQNTNRRIR
jgi:hypothetical protein